jgi:hypothetical protein
MFEIFGRRVSTSMTMARNVLTSDTASAPDLRPRRERRDVRDVRRQLGNDRQGRDLPDRDDVVGAVQAATG